MDIGKQKRVIIVELEELAETASADSRDIEGDLASNETDKDREPALQLDLQRVADSAGV